MKKINIFLLVCATILSGIVRAETENSSNISFELGAGVNYGMIGGALNYKVSPSTEIFVAGGLGFALGVKYYTSDSLRLIVNYGTNSADSNQFYSGLNIGVGYLGGSRDGWTVDLMYLASSTGGALSGIPIKLSFGYRF